MVTTVADLGEGVGDALDVLELATAVLNRNLEMLRRRTDVYTDLDRAEYLVLRTLVQLGQADIGSLAAALGVDPSTAGRQVAGLAARGLIDRTAAEDDRRRSIVAPTDEGRRRTDLTRERRRTATADMLSDWTADELRRLGELLTRYNKAVADRYLTR
jgi:DNA-binding MarR family transcriptional regulator